MSQWNSSPMEVSSRCEQVLERACQSLAGGDSSTMRVLPYQIPLVAKRGEGARVWDVDDKEYIDLNMAYGPLIFGHCPRHVIDAVWKQISENGSQLGFPTEISMRVAEKVKELYPVMERLRFANSGTEAMASAVRLARAYTDKKTLVMFEGHYHGWSEAVFNKYHAPLEKLSPEGFGPAIEGTSGMCGGLENVVVVRWNDLDALERCLKRHNGSVAAVVMEPVMGNAGTIAPRDGYLQGVRELTLDNDCLLIFDEVISGLRVSAGGAQEHYAVSPDITVISKALGGGYPVAAFGAAKEIMDIIVQGKMFHGGVFSGNAVVMAAAEAVLTEIIANRDEMYGYLHSLTGELMSGIHDILSRLGVRHIVSHVGPLMSVFLTTSDVDDLYDYRDVRRYCDFEKYIEFQHFMQQSGVFFHPNQFEPMFLSTAHSSNDIAAVLERVEEGARHCLLS